MTHVELLCNGPLHAKEARFFIAKWIQTLSISPVTWPWHWIRSLTSFLVKP